jgi:hypothetical protein
MLSIDSGSGSSKIPSGVAAELERDRVAELGDAAMGETFGTTRAGPVMPQCRKFPTCLAPTGQGRVEPAKLT